jgi:hypothetical protein
MTDLRLKRKKSCLNIFCQLLTRLAGVEIGVSEWFTSSALLVHASHSIAVDSVAAGAAAKMTHLHGITTSSPITSQNFFFSFSILINNGLFLTKDYAKYAFTADSRARLIVLVVQARNPRHFYRDPPTRTSLVALSYVKWAPRDHSTSLNGPEKQENGMKHDDTYWHLERSWNKSTHKNHHL